LVVLDRLVQWVGEQPTTGPTGMVARLAGELIADIRALTMRVNALEREITNRAEQVAPALLGLCGSVA
jgi:transposase